MAHPQHAPRSKAHWLAFGTLTLGLCLLAGNRLWAAPQAVPVKVAHPVEKSSFDHDYTATLEPAQQAKLLAGANGQIAKVSVRSGDLVKAGAVLFELGAEPLKKELQAAQTAQQQWVSQQAALTQQIQAAKTPLEKDRLTAQQEVVAARLQIATARTTRIEQELASLIVRAPFDGVVEGVEVKPGDPVTAGQLSATPLCTLVDLSSVQAVFAMEETCLNLIGQLIRDQALQVKEVHALPVAVGLPGETGFPHVGRVVFVDNQVDPKLHRIAVRAALPNPAGKLSAAALAVAPQRPQVRLRLTLPTTKPQLVIPLQAVSTAADGTAQVLVVNAKQAAEVRPVKLGPTVDDLQVIMAGLKPADWVIVGAEALPDNADDTTLSPNDFSSDVERVRVRPGMLVAPQQVNFATDVTTAPAVEIPETDNKAPAVEKPRE